jgi:hypothetical protein
MDPNVSTLERAFALAASGRFHKVSDIRLQLHREGYNYELVQGPALAKQLSEAMEQAHRREADGAEEAREGREEASAIDSTPRANTKSELYPRGR